MKYQQETGSNTYNHKVSVVSIDNSVVIRKSSGKQIFEPISDREIQTRFICDEHHFGQNSPILNRL